MISQPCMTLGRAAGFSAAVVLLSLPVLAQTGNTIVGAGYYLDLPAVVAPGSIINLRVQGVGSTLTSRVTAATFPLPIMLAGITVTLTQQFGPSGVPQSQPIPVLAVEPVATCVNGSTDACSKFTAVTIQVPFEISSITPNRTRLVVSEGGVAGGAVDLQPYPDHVHVASACDVEAGATFSCGNELTVTPRLITHADGTVVTLVNPARSGEELVMWAVGLGLTTPNVSTGQPSPSPAAITQPVRLNFDYRSNAPPYMPYCATALSCPLVPPLFSGLTPGYAGLYQVNFVVPPPPPGTPACNAATFVQGDPSKVATNMTVSIIASTSLDGGGICVDTAGSSASNVAAAAVHPPLSRVSSAPRVVVPDSIRLSGRFGPADTRDAARLAREWDPGSTRRNQTSRRAQTLR